MNGRYRTGFQRWLLLPRWGGVPPQTLALAQAPSIEAAFTENALELAATQLWAATVVLFAEVSPTSCLVLLEASGGAGNCLRCIKKPRRELLASC